MNMFYGIYINAKIIYSEFLFHDKTLVEFRHFKSFLTPYQFQKINRTICFKYYLN